MQIGMGTVDNPVFRIQRMILQPRKRQLSPSCNDWVFVGQ